MNGRWYIAKVVLAALPLFAVACSSSDDHPLGVTTPRAEYAEELEQVLEGADGDRIDARTTNGKIAVSGTAGTAVVVNISKEVRAPTKEEAEAFAREVEIHVERDGEGIRIYEEYPDTPDGVQVEVNYHIRCPSRVDLELITTNGTVTAEAVVGRVRATATNGNVEIEGEHGPFYLQTTNGNVEADVAQLVEEASFSATNGNVDVAVRAGAAPLSATTSNGSVQVALHAEFSGQLDAATVNGTARSEFPTHTSAGDPPTRLTGELGEGGSSSVVLRAVNGDVRLTKL